MLINTIGVALCFAVHMLWGGWVIATLWSWFMVPLGVKPISLFQAYGMYLLLSCMLSTRGISKTDKPNLLFSIVAAIVLPAACLFFGWLAKLGM